MKLSIHTVLLAMITVLVAPAAVFLGLILYERQVKENEQILRAGDQIATEITTRLENEFRSARTMLAVFASSGWLEAGELRELHQRAQSALRGTNRHLIVVDRGGHQLLNTRVPYGTELGRSADVDTIERVFTTGIDAVSNLFEGRVANTLVYNVLRRATTVDGQQRVLILTRDVADLAPILAQNLSDEGWGIGVFDGAGKPAYIALAADSKPADVAMCEPKVEAADQDWSSGHRVVRRLVRPSEWHTCTWTDTRSVALAGGGSGQVTFLILWALGAVIAAIALGFMLSRSISSAAKVAEALDSGGEVPDLSSPITEISDVLRAFVQAVRARQAKDAELLMMAREASHRAKNQIAIATSILRLAARRATSTEQLVTDMTHRMAALGRSVDMMVGGSIDSAPLASLVSLQLGPFVHDQPDLFVVEGEHFAISQSAAQSFGLILHEFATNASKYGAWSHPGGRVHVGWTRQNDTLKIVWTETSTAEAPAPTGTGFGTNLIDFIVQRSFGGTIEREFLPTGFRATIVVPASRVASPHSAQDADADTADDTDADTDTGNDAGTAASA